MSLATSLERYLLKLINKERSKRGIDELVLEQNLNKSADKHSEWMLKTDVFSHTGVNGTSSSDRMRKAGFDMDGSWHTGENLGAVTIGGKAGLKDDVRRLHENLMDSPAHKAELLHPDFEYAGIGIKIGNFDFGGGRVAKTMMATENFGRTSGEGKLDLQGNGRGNRLSGEDGNDTIKGKGGNDRIKGKDGNDRIDGGSGRDKIDGGDGRDKIKGGDGRDKIDGGNGRDKLYGQDGNDRLEGGRGKDTLKGGDGRDKLKGESGNDKLYGQRGDDKLDGGSGNDKLKGGSGADSFVFRDGYDRDKIRDFSGKDEIRLDDNLWEGNLSARQVVNRFADVVDGNVEFDFGGGDVLTLQGVDSTRGLASDIDIF
ncbi:PaxA, putative [Oceanicola granulosus HTCC2516]|uniref:PaxA, putative n=1 Tax=Oceanicola granulosus (strain ATCC BAA-861 / DSM 15982 / KCTC 12143 / HTCC2516) TaxID=314256 RepID=Q2C9V2_OCEGH|nr:CAP domain-containing protein [Oceanicola granulosus]EAR49446.1 PaxA, putative [Oceanicola granulosus HTCC2516]